MTELDAVIVHLQSLFEAYSPTVNECSVFQDHLNDRSIFTMVVQFPFSDYGRTDHIFSVVRGLGHVEIPYMLRGDGFTLAHIRFTFPGFDPERSAQDGPDSEVYHDNMPGMTLDEFQALSDGVIRDALDT